MLSHMRDLVTLHFVTMLEYRKPAERAFFNKRSLEVGFDERFVQRTPYWKRCKERIATRRPFT